jgi:hypothetical protein
MLTLTETGTHAQIDAAVDGFCSGEPELAIRLASLAAGMLVIMDRGFPESPCGARMPVGCQKSACPVSCGDGQGRQLGHHDHPCLCACPNLIFARLCGWLVLLGRSSLRSPR